MTSKDKIKEILEKHFKVSSIEIIDESFKHAGHNEDAKKGGTHMQLLIVSDDFTGKSSVARHKMIYKILDSEFKAGLHALSIKALTTQESQK